MLQLCNNNNVQKYESTQQKSGFCKLNIFHLRLQNIGVKEKGLESHS